MSDQMKSIAPDAVRIGMDPEAIRQDFKAHLNLTLGKDADLADELDHFHALSLTVRDRLMDGWLQSQRTALTEKKKCVAYLSLEYLMGRVLGNNLVNLGIEQTIPKLFEDLNLDFSQIASEEPDMGLGNGGLGRLAACYIDSMASLGLHAIGYGLRYNYGIFRQAIENGRQVEQPDDWLRWGSPWEIPRLHRQYTVHFGGRTETYNDNGAIRRRWVDSTPVIGMAYDVPIVGYGGKTVNTLRLWGAHAAEDFDFSDFDKGDYVAAVENKVLAENLTKVLYPNDMHEQGKELRLRQQYLFVSCSIQDIVRRFKQCSSDWSEFPALNAIQMNDTHPSLAVPELMRILVDEEKLGWNQAWDLVVPSLAYTNHTLMPEALETWPVDLLSRLLPRLYEIILEINARFLDDIRKKFPKDAVLLNQNSIVDLGFERKVRMANLSIVGSHKVNGVAEIHSQLLQDNVVPAFAKWFPERFTSVTNGVTPRRWLKLANPELSQLIDNKIGSGWISDLSQLSKLKSFAEDSGFQEDFWRVKRGNKARLIQHVQKTWGWRMNPEAIFDVHVKRIHEYKRQLMNILHVASLYLKLKNEPNLDMHPQLFLFGGKAAPGYFLAKQIIRLIHDVSRTIEADPMIREKLQVLFLPNYGVSLAQLMVPAAEVSEQISCAGFEASGTGNMKFMLNGALTIGTLDGANIEMAEEVGKEHMFIFGLTAEEVANLTPHYHPRSLLEQNPWLKETVTAVFGGVFSDGDKERYRALQDSLLDHGDYFKVLADLEPYAKAQELVQKTYVQKETWIKKAILNTASAGKFSSDRSIQDYNDRIWHS